MIGGVVMLARDALQRLMKDSAAYRLGYPGVNAVAPPAVAADYPTPPVAAPRD